MRPEEEAFLEGLYRAHYQRLCLYAYAVLGDRARAQDAVQDTFHEALSHLEKLMVHGNPGGWLMLTLRNKLHDCQRARQRYLKRFLSLESDLDPQDLPAGLMPEDPEETLEMVRQALTPEEYRLIERLIFDGASHGEVAQELGITPWASQKRLERVRKKLDRVFPGFRRRGKDQT